MTSEVAYRWILFLLNPFTSMIVSFVEYRHPYARNMFWAFCIFFGLTFVVGKESVTNDIVRYHVELQRLHEFNQFSMADAVNYFKNSGEVDYLRIIISYVLSRFTDSQTILTLTYAIIFGFFFSRNIWYIFSFFNGRLSYLERLLVLCFVLIIPIWFINGFRMWTAFHIFMYGLLPFVIERKRSRLLFTLLSFFVHFSFVIPLAILLLFAILGNRIKLYFTLFIFSIFIGNVNITIVNQYAEMYLPTAIEERSESYRAEDRVEQVRESQTNFTGNWYVKWYRKLISWSLTAVLIYFFVFRRQEIKSNLVLKSLFSVGLLYFSLSNIVSSLPSGGRFLNFALFLTIILVLFYMFHYANDSRTKRLISYMTPAFVLFAIVSIRIGFYNTSLSTIIGNPIFAVLTAGENLSLNDLIK